MTTIEKIPSNIGITTSDNPFDYFNNSREWRAYDRMLGHNTPSLLARVVVYSEELSEADQFDALELGIDQIIKHDPLGIYRKVYRDQEPPKPLKVNRSYVLRS